MSLRADYTIEIYKGDDMLIKIPVYDSDGAAYALTGTTAAYFYVKVNPDDSAYSFSRSNAAGDGITIDTTNKRILVYIIPTNTKALALGTYYWDCKIVDATKLYTIAKGDFIVKEVVHNQP